MPERVRVTVPATTANLGPGFDALGLALDLVNVFEFVRRPDAKLDITIAGDGGQLPRTAENLAWQAFVQAHRRWGLAAPQGGFALHIACGVPLVGGLGSSATAIVGGVLAAAAFAGKRAPHDLLATCAAIEGHPDNVAPALLGGLVVLAAGGEGLAHLPLPAPSLVCALCSPAISLSTKAARQALPDRVPFADAVFNAGRAALLIGALGQRRWDLLSVAMEDRLHQPYRAPLVPGMPQALAAARQAGAAAACLSGAGPSVIAFCEDEARAKRAGAAMQAAFAQAAVPSEWRIVRPRAQGAQVESFAA